VELAIIDIDPRRRDRLFIGVLLFLARVLIWLHVVQSGRGLGQQVDMVVFVAFRWGAVGLEDIDLTFVGVSIIWAHPECGPDAAGVSFDRRQLCTQLETAVLLGEFSILGLEGSCGVPALLDDIAILVYIPLFVGYRLL